MILTRVYRDRIFPLYGRLISARTFLSSTGEIVSSTTNIYDGLDLATEIQNGAAIARSAVTFGRASGLSLGDEVFWGRIYTLHI